MSQTEKGFINHSPFDFDGLPYPQVRFYPKLFSIKMTAMDVKEITYRP